MAFNYAFDWSGGEDRISLFPIQNHEIWNIYKSIEGSVWTVGEVRMDRDRKDWDVMPADEKQLVKMQLAFFATIDIAVLDNICSLSDKITGCLELKCLLAAQAAQECVHAEAYALQITTITEGEEQRELLNAAREMPIIKKMHAWVSERFTELTKPGEWLASSIAVEGLLFCSSFTVLQWLRTVNKLPGITEFNDYISRDEHFHTVGGCTIYSRHLRSEYHLRDEQLKEVFGSMVVIIDEFIEYSIPNPIQKLNAADLKRHLRDRANSVVSMMTRSTVILYRPVSDKPALGFMNFFVLNTGQKNNFFEHQPTQYQNPSKPGLANMQLAAAADEDDI